MMKRYSWLVGVLAGVMLLSALTLISDQSQAASSQAPKFVLRVNAGHSVTYADKAGNVWQAGKYYAKGGGYGFRGGDTVDRGSDVKIQGTEDPRIYQTEHYGMTGFTAEVPNGKYTVRLHFAETYPDIMSDGPRVFDVKIQGQEVLKDFDVAKTAGSAEKALVKEFTGIEVTGGVLEIAFGWKSQNPEINGIEIIGE